LRKKLGSIKTDTLIEMYSSGNLDEFIKILLLDYYDKLYRHTLDNYVYLDRINNTDTVEASRAILEVVNKSLSCKKG